MTGLVSQGYFFRFSKLCLLPIKEPKQMQTFILDYGIHFLHLTVETQFSGKALPAKHVWSGDLERASTARESFQSLLGRSVQFGFRTSAVIDLSPSPFQRPHKRISSKAQRCARRKWGFLMKRLGISIRLLYIWKADY